MTWNPAAQNVSYVFVGNRFLVLEKLLRRSAQISAICAVPESFLAKELTLRRIPHHLFHSKQELLSLLEKMPYDVLVSNGCPYRLPISRLAKPDRKYVNVHPSLLPDLKGIHPVNGAFLFGRDAGATCHLMDDQIDHGPIVSQVKIERTPAIDLGMLYRMSFEAEAQAFEMAFDRAFEAMEAEPTCPSPVYYSRKDSDLKFSLSDAIPAILSKVSAFNSPNLGAYFEFNDVKFRVFEAEAVDHPFLHGRVPPPRQLEIVYLYPPHLLIKKDSVFLKLKFVSGNLESLKEGDVLL